MPKVSIITPVYNAAVSLQRSIDSVKNQTFKEWELILVDDGSQDDSPFICDKNAEQDPRIRCIHKNNGGVSSARQIGQDNAFGEYTIHLDSDDIIEPDMLENLYSFAKQKDADIVFCDYIEDKNGLSKLYHENLAGKSSETLIELLYGSQICCSLWNKLVRRTFYLGKVNFAKGVNMGEDLLWCIDVLSLRPKIAYLPKAYYHYNRNNESSLTRKITKSTVVSDFRLVECIDQRTCFNPTLRVIAYSNICVEALFRAFVSHNYGSKEFMKMYGHLRPYIFKSFFRIWLKVLMFFATFGFYSIAYSVYAFLTKNKISKIKT